MSTYGKSIDSTGYDVPSLIIQRCDDENDDNAPKARAVINKRLGSLADDFPRATVDICYTDTTIRLVFTAYDEVSYHMNESYQNNDPIFDYTVMEAFVAAGGWYDPTSYLEFEVAPNNVTWTGFIQNPNKNFTPSAAAMITDLNVYPIIANTSTDPSQNTWTSVVSLPLSMFNIANPEGTQWRMNFFRTYYKDSKSPQEFGAWNPNKLISFHQTPYFGKVRFVTSPKSSFQTIESNITLGQCVKLILILIILMLSQTKALMKLLQQRCSMDNSIKSR